MRQKQTLTAVALAIIGIVAFVAHASPTSAVAPLAARLIGAGETVVNISGFPGNVRGITTDGTKVYMRSSDHGESRIYETNFSGTGTTFHTVTGPGGAANPMDGVVTTEQTNLAYSHGCIWVSSHDGRLFCVSTSTWVAHEVTVPVSKPLPDGQWWMFSNMLDFPDGRIGRISYPDGANSNWSSTLRVYSVSGNGDSATVSWSEDFTLADSGRWPDDDHGVATDGVYMYRIHCCWSAFKSWTLVSGGTSTVAHDGSELGLGNLNNATFITHDHVHDRYLVGDYDGAAFYYTGSQDPGTGPGSATTTTTTTTSTTSTTVAPTTTISATTVPSATTTAPAGLNIVVNAPTTVAPTGTAVTTNSSPATGNTVAHTTGATVTPVTATLPPTTTTLPNNAGGTVAPPAPKPATVVAGQAGLTVGGSEVETVVTRADNQLVVTAGDMTARLGVVRKDGSVGNLDGDGNIRLREGERIRVTLNGFKAGTTVEVWLFSSPVLLGTTKVGADGKVVGDFAVPANVSSGAHRIAVVTRTGDDKPATLTVGILVGEWDKGPAVTVWLIVLPIVLAVTGALTIPATRRRRRSA